MGEIVTMPTARNNLSGLSHAVDSLWEALETHETLVMALDASFKALVKALDGFVAALDNNLAEESHDDPLANPPA